MTTTITTPSGAPVDGVRIVDMPDLGAVTDTSSVVGEHAGSGRFSATALRDYVLASAVTPPDTGTGTGMITFTDGVHTVEASQLAVSGGVISGTSPSATLTIGDVTFTDGAHTVAGSNLAVTGGTIGGASPNVTLTISPAAGAIMAVTNIAALRALVTVSSPVFVEGYYASGDGGEGVFVLGAAGSDNGGTIIVSAAGTYYRERGSSPVSVKWFGAKGDGATNDIAALQAAANALQATGGVLAFPTATYATANTLSISSATLIEGNKATLLAVPGFPTNAHMLVNQNNGATTLTDHDIIVRELTFDYGSASATGGSHAINFAFVRNVAVEDCTFQCRGAGDAVALIGCYNTVTDGCTAYGFTNCAYDHWWGPNNARVVNCYAETASSSQIALFNPDATTGTANYQAKGFVLSNCTFNCTGPTAAAIQIEPLGSSGSVWDATVEGNTFINCILTIRRNTSGVVVSNNVFDSPLGGNSAITCQVLDGGTPQGVSITGNVIVDPGSTSGAVAVIVVWTNFAVVANNMIYNGSLSGIDTSTYNPVVIGNRVTSGVVNTTGAAAQTGTMRLNNGLAFIGGDASSSGDLTKHIALNAGGNGINLESNQVGIVTAGSVAFYVSGTRQGYVDATGINGPFGQGTRYPGLFTTLGSTGLFQSTAGMVSNVPNTGSPLIQFEYLGSAVGSITTNGSSSAFNATSDYRLKTTTGPCDGSRIDAIPVYEGYFNALPDEPQAVVLAHEVAAVMPQIVVGDKDAVDESDEPVYQGLDYSKIVPDLIAKCQALERRLAVLEQGAAS